VNAALASFVKIGPNQYNQHYERSIAFTQAAFSRRRWDTQTLYSTQFNALVATAPQG